MLAELAGLIGGSDMACAINDVNKRLCTSSRLYLMLKYFVIEIVSISLDLIHLAKIRKIDKILKIDKIFKSYPFHKFLSSTLRN